MRAVLAQLQRARYSWQWRKARLPLSPLDQRARRNIEGIPLPGFQPRRDQRGHSHHRARRRCDLGPPRDAAGKPQDRGHDAVARSRAGKAPRLYVQVRLLSMSGDRVEQRPRAGAHESHDGFLPDLSRLPPRCSARLDAGRRARIRSRRVGHGRQPHSLRCLERPHSRNRCAVYTRVWRGKRRASRGRSCAALSNLRQRHRGEWQHRLRWSADACMERRSRGVVGRAECNDRGNERARSAESQPQQQQQRRPHFCEPVAFRRIRA
jgi:hypothetical protein